MSPWGPAWPGMPGEPEGPDGLRRWGRGQPVAAMGLPATPRKERSTKDNASKTGVRTASSRGRQLRKLKARETPLRSSRIATYQHSMQHPRHGTHAEGAANPGYRTNLPQPARRHLSRPVKQHGRNIGRAGQLTPTARSRHGAQRGPRSQGGPRDPRDPGAHPDQSRRSCPWHLFCRGGGVELRRGVCGTRTNLEPSATSGERQTETVDG